MRLEHAAEHLIHRVQAMGPAGGRRLIAIAGPPASGKSTLAEAVAEGLQDARVVPMDGFHLDNRLLKERGLLHRKGAPETFDVAGFKHLLTRLVAEGDVIYPLFDRSLDCSIAGAGHIDAQVETIIVEGNYLLLDAPGWRDLRPFWSLAVFLATPIEILRERLLQRWRTYGFDEIEAARKVETNDLPNARTIEAALTTPDLVLTDDG